MPMLFPGTNDHENWAQVLDAHRLLYSLALHGLCSECTVLIVVFSYLKGRECIEERKTKNVLLE